MISRWKARTHDTHMKRDLPYLLNLENSTKYMLLGDSHFERLLTTNKGKLLKFLKNNVFNASVGGDRIENILYRLESKQGLLCLLGKKRQPKVMVIMMGSNNLLMNPPDSPTSLVDKFIMVLEYIQTQLPQTKLITWAIPNDFHNTPSIAKYNKLLEKVCKKYDVDFSDELYQFTRIKSKNMNMFADHIHLSTIIYSRVVIPILNKYFIYYKM